MDPYFSPSFNIKFSIFSCQHSFLKLRGNTQISIKKSYHVEKISESKNMSILRESIQSVLNKNTSAIIEKFEDGSCILII